MAMNGDLLGLAMKAAIDGVGDKTDRNALFKALGGAIVAHIEANAVVSGPVTVTSVSGVTAGPGASGPGTGTLSGGTIT